MSEPPQPRAQGEPQGRPAPHPGPGRLLIAACAVMLACLFAWNSWKRDFWSPAEPTFALLAREIQSSGDLLPPVPYGEPVLQIPPLVPWLGAAIHEATGLDARLAYRVPGIVCAVLGTWLTFIAGRSLFDGRIGFLALALQASMYCWFRRATWVTDDIPFATFLQLTILGFALSTRRGASPRWAILGWVGLAGCTLSKSLPLALLLAGATLVPFLFLETGLGGIVTGWRRARCWKGILLFLCLTLPWYVAIGVKHGSEVLRAHCLDQNFSHAFTSFPGSEAVQSYLVILAIGFLPWSLFVPLGVLHAKDRLDRTGERLAFFWIVVPFVLLLVIPAKSQGALLVIASPIALLIAAGLFESRQWFSVWEGFLRQGVFTGIPALMKVPLFLMLILAAAYFTGYLEKLSGDKLREILSDRTGTIWAIGLLAGASGLVYALGPRVRRLVEKKDLPRAAFEVSCAALFVFFAASFLDEGCNPVFSARGVVERFSKHIPGDSSIMVYGRIPGELFYYLDSFQGSVRRLPYPDPSRRDDPALQEIESVLKSPQPAYLLATRSELQSFERLYPSLSQLLHPLEEGAVGRDQVYVLLRTGKAP